MTYDRYPQVDENFLFPLEVQEANFGSDTFYAQVKETLVHGVLADGTDLNTLYLTEHIGDYTLMSGYTYLNAPPGMSETGVLEVRRGGGTSASTLHRVTSGAIHSWREATNASTGLWSTWSQTALASVVDALGPAWAPVRSVPSDGNMNTYRVPGVSRIRTPDTATIQNLPPGMKSWGLVENIVTGDGTDGLFAQRITEGDVGGREWRRSWTIDSGAFTPWTLGNDTNDVVKEWHVFLAAGQSNMSGRGILGTVAGGRYVNSRIAQFGATRRVLETATVPLDMHDTSSGLSPATVFAQNYLKNKPSHIGVLIVPAAHGATGFTNSTTTNTWTPNVATNPALDLSKLAVTQTKDALAAARATGAIAELKGILWHQGENNSSYSTSSYASNLDALISYFRSELDNSNLPFLVGQMVPEGIAANAGRPNIDLAHRQTPTRVPFTAFAPATTGGYNPGDTTHMSKTGVDYIGRSYFEAYTQVLIGAPAVASVPDAVASYISSNPTVVQSVADRVANDASLLPKWKPNTSYSAGQQAVSPSGDILTRTTSGSTGSTFTMTNWTASDTATSLASLIASKGANSGLATLDSNGKHPLSETPDVLKTDSGAKPVGKGELFKNIRDYKLAGAADDAAAISAAHAANPVVFYPDGDYSPGLTNLYGAYSNALGPRIQAGKSGSPILDARPVMWVRKYSSASRSVNSSEWDNGSALFDYIKESGSAYGAALTGYAQHKSSDGGQIIGVHARASAYKAESEVWGLWTYGHASDPAVIPKTIIGHELDMNIKTVDQGWMETGGVGASIGQLIVTADSSERITAGLMVGKGISAPNGYMWSGIVVRPDSIVPSGANSATQVNNGEAIRVAGSVSVGNAYNGIRFMRNLSIGISLAEATIANNAAILLADKHRIIVGAGAGAGAGTAKYLEFDATNTLINLGNINLGFMGTKILGSRKTGWGTPTGTVDRTAFGTYTAPTYAAAPTMADMQALANQVQSGNRHLAALIIDLIAHGLVGA